MKKLLWIKDSKEFWEVFSEEQRKRREKLRRLPFAKKIEIVSKMQKANLIKKPGKVQRGSPTRASFEISVQGSGRRQNGRG